ncbi:MAG: MBL fold metallo-hydrolase [Alphaproteobacteria bacterium]|nr:MAG: MBL fold metallo-hydrolase [Alphaproteobacteria bacterium]
MKVTVLGCGTSSGVPRLPGIWGACDPNDPRNRRRRASLLVETADTRIVIDCGPDFRAQLLDHPIPQLDAVLLSHDHADHAHGIDDLRGFATAQKERIPVYGMRETLDVITRRFDYIFDGSNGYPPIARAIEIAPFREFTVGSLEILPFLQHHGPVSSLGFRIGPLAYSTDVKALPEESFTALSGVKVWIADALRYRPHPTHACLEETLSWIARVGPERAILTHLNQDMDYAALAGQLPADVEPAFDGLSFTL